MSQQLPRRARVKVVLIQRNEDLFSRQEKERELITPKRGIMRVVREVDVSSSVEERVGKEEGEEGEEEEEEGSKWSRGRISRRNVTREVEPITTGEL